MTRSPQKSLGDALIHFALMREHAQGNLDDQLVTGSNPVSLSVAGRTPSRTREPAPV